MKKRLLAFLLAFAMVAGFIPLSAAPAFADGEPTVTYNGDQTVTCEAIGTIPEFEGTLYLATLPADAAYTSFSGTPVGYYSNSEDCLNAPEEASYYHDDEFLSLFVNDYAYELDSGKTFPTTDVKGFVIIDSDYETYFNIVVIQIPEVQTPPVTTVNVTYRAQAYNAIIVMGTETVSSDLAESYGYTDSITDGVSALDVMVAAHIAALGDDFTAEKKDDYLAVGSSGYVSCLFGVETYANGFLVNQGYPNDGTESSYGGYNGTTVSTTKVNSGDLVEFVIYGDTTGWSDSYTWLTVPESVNAGAEFTVSCVGNSYMSAYMYGTPAAFKAAGTALEDACIGWYDAESGMVTPIEGVVFDEDGNVTITAPATAGTYYLTALSNVDAEVYVFINPAELNVVQPVFTAEVTYRVQEENAFIVKGTETVSSNLAESYGYADSISDGVSALDVMVAAHIATFGEDFTPENKDDYLAVSSTGYVTTLFEQPTTANGFLVNQGYPNDGTASAWGGYNGTTVSTTKVSDGDLVEFVFYGDTDYWSDYYTWLTVPESVEAGTEFTVSCVGTMFVMGYMYSDSEEFKEAAEPLEDACIGWYDAESGMVTPIEGVVFDEYGKVTITAPTDAGTYYLTALSNDYVYVFINPAELIVTAYSMDDLYTMAKYAAQLITLTESEIAAYDVNGDGKLDSLDVALVAKTFAQ